MHWFLEGSIVKISPTQSFGNFRKREFLVQTEDINSQLLKLEFHNDDVAVLENFIEGEMVTVAFIITGSEWQGKHFTNMVAIAIAPTVENKVYDEFKKAKKEFKDVQQIVDDNEK